MNLDVDLDWSLTDASICLKQGSEGCDLGAIASDADAVLTLNPTDGVIYVSADSNNPNGDGSSWSNATPYLQYAVSRANTFTPAAQVWVSEGDYVGDGINTNNAFSMMEGVDVYGGFAGTETSLAERNIELHVSVLDGQNVQRVLYQNEPFATETAWDGFAIRNGFMSETDFYAYNSSIIKNPVSTNSDWMLNQVHGAGAAIMENGVLRNVDFGNNNIARDASVATNASNLTKGTALSMLGGVLDSVSITNDSTVYVSTANSAINSYLFAINGEIRNSNFNHNIGKIMLWGTRVENTVFENNQVCWELPETDNVNEAQLFANASTFVNCKFARNNAVAVSKSGSGTVYGNIYQNCLFVNNNAVAIRNHTSQDNDTFTNCNIIGNKSQNTAAVPVSGGIFNNTVVWGNRDYLDMPAHFSSSNLNSSYVFNHCAVELGLEGYPDIISLASSNTGTSEAYAYPYFLAPDADDYELCDASCLINAGDNSVVTAEHDYLGQDRMADGIVDIGAYEYKCMHYYEYSDVTQASAYPFCGEWLTESGQYIHRFWLEDKDCDSVVVLNLHFKRIIYVTETGSGLKNGTSWENAYGTLYEAMEASGQNTDDLTQIWVAQGLYRGDGTSVNAFRIFPNVQLYGGFVGNELADYDITQRDYENHVTTLDGDYIQRVIYMVEDATEETAPIIDGFTIKNGFSRANVSQGTAMFLKQYVHVRNCNITENYTMSGVGAVYIQAEDINNCDVKKILNTFENCKFTRNQGTYAVHSSNTSFTNCSFENNDRRGVEIVTYTKFDNCTFTANKGRAVWLIPAFKKFQNEWKETYTIDYMDMTNCVLTNNGGGIAYKIRTCGGHGEGNIMSTVIVSNTTTDVENYTMGQDGFIKHNYQKGGAIFGDESTPINIVCSTILNNCAQKDGGGLYGSSFHLTNTILSGNKAGSKSNQLSNYYCEFTLCEEELISMISIETYDMKYCAIEGGYPGEGNITLNNKFRLDLSGYTPDTLSACVNQGTTEGVTVPEYDIYGNSRVRQGRIDIGAVESNLEGPVLMAADANDIMYVSPEGSGTMNGSSWENATPYLQMAQNFALTMNPKPQIWVKEGTYLDDNPHFWSGYAMMPGVNVYGGFAGNEPASYNLDDRDLNNHLSILDGQNKKRILEQIDDFNAENTVVWDGFIMRNGYARKGYTDNIIALTESEVDSYFGSYMNGGAAIMKTGGTFRNCNIYSNNATKGGGIYKTSNGGLASNIFNCKISQNFATEEGGGIYSNMPSGYFNGTTPVDTIANCEINDNKSDRHGALRTNRTLVLNTSIIHNTTDLYAFDTLTSGHQYNRFVNCVLWGNSSRNYAFQTEGSLNTYDYCAIQGGGPAEGSGEGLINLAQENTGDDPSVNYPNFLDSDNYTYRPLENSSFINLGDNSHVFGSYDLAFKNRIKDDVVDMGAYEETCINYVHRDVVVSESYDFYGQLLTESGDYSHQWTPEGAECDSLVSLHLDIRHIYYVTPTGSGTKDGRSWENAMDNIQTAINRAYNDVAEYGPGQVWVAAGTYAGNGTSSQAFQLKPNVNIYGGFHGNEVMNVNFDARDFSVDSTVLTGSHCQRVVGNYGNESSFSQVNKAVIDGFVIRDGYSTGNGGGVYVKNFVTVQNCKIYNNQGGKGAGVYADNRSEITQCDIYSNTALSDGGGAYCSSSTLTYCHIHNNLCDNTSAANQQRRGAGIFGRNATINNCLIANNSALTDNSFGGGMYIDNSTVQSQLLNCTMVNNFSYNLGGGVYSVNSGSNNEFINCVLWGNKTLLNTQQVAVSASNVPIYMRYCAVQGGCAGIGNINLTAANTGSSIFAPQFISLSENVGANYGGGDWHFADGSILANHGERMTYTLTHDLDSLSNARLKNDRIDIGAYESNFVNGYHAEPDAHNIIYVNVNNHGGDMSGDSWENAIPDLQLAINFAGDDDNHPKVWIAGGTYTSNGWPYVDAFVALNGIDLYGGFAGNETYDYDLDERDLVAHQTILDGQNIQRTLHQAHSTFFKYKQIEELHSAIYDGLTIRNGFVYKNDGGGVRMQKGDLRNCIVENCHALSGSNGGGGIVKAASNVTVSNSIIRNCKAEDCYYGGGGSYGNITFNNCLLANNSAIVCRSNTSGGGAAYSGTFVNSTIVNNYSDVNGGGLAGSYTVKNSIVWGNKVGNNLPCNLFTARTTAENVFADSDVTFSAIEGGMSGIGNITLNGGNEGSDDVNYPMFAEPSIAAGSDYQGGDWTLMEGSVCIGHGNNAYVNGEYDLSHNPRVRQYTVDMGAYESPYDQDFEITPDANNIIYVTQNGAGDMNGSSWADATPYLQYALDRASLMSPKPVIWVAAGSYHGDGTPQFPAFILPKGVSIYGSFAGDEPATYDLALRDFETNTSFLDGHNLQQIMRHDESNGNNYDYIDGFVFQNGRSNRSGGAANLVKCYVDNCKFYNNTCVDEGSLSISGGALNISGCKVYHSEFVGNYSMIDGGAIKESGSIISHCLIKGNRADRNGGGIMGGNELYDCEISSNSAVKGGGAYNVNKMRNCTVVKNTADITSGGDSKNGGGIYNLGGSDAFGGTLYNTVTNNVIWGNKTGALVSNIRGTTPNAGTLTYNAIERDEVMPSGTGNIVIESANDGTDATLNYARFTNPDDGDFRLLENSMCIDVGSNDYAAPGDYDLDGNERIRGGFIDMGAYEQTPINCKVPTNLQVPEELLTYTTADVTWTPGGDETQWLVYYARSNGSDVQTVAVDTNYIQLQNLHPNLGYFVKVRSMCGGDEMSSYCVPKYFNTLCDPDSIVWTNYLVEEGLVPLQDQTLESNSHIYFSWDYIDGAESYDLYLWRTDHGNGLPIPDFPVAYGLTRNYTTVDLYQSNYQGYGVYDHCPGWGCDPEPPVYLRQVDPYETAYYAWKVVAHKQCATIESDTMYFNTALPDLHVTSMDHSFAQTGQVMTVEWTVKNDGVGPTPVGEEWNDYIVLSYPVNWERVSFTDTPAESFLMASVPNLMALNPGEQYTNSVNITVPDDMYGSVFLFVLSNWKPYSGMSLDFTPYGGVFPNPYNPPYIPHDPGDPEGYMEGSCSPESFEEIHGCDNFFYQYIDVAIPPIPDLVARNVISPYDHQAGDSITISWNLINQGGAAFEPTLVTDVVYMTMDSVFNTNAIQIGTFADTIAMGINDTITRVARFITDERKFGDYNFFVRTDSRNQVYESLFEYNNMSLVSEHSCHIVPPPTPDLIIDSLVVGSHPVADTLAPNAVYPVYFRVTNVGLEPCKVLPGSTGTVDTCGTIPPFRGKAWNDKLYFSQIDTFNVAHSTLITSFTNDTILYLPDMLIAIDTLVRQWAECHYAIPDTLSEHASHNDSIRYQNAVAQAEREKQNYLTRQLKKYIGNYHRQGFAYVPENAVEGWYYFYAKTDSEDAIFEYGCNDNNVAKDSVYVVQPDLKMLSVEISEDRSHINYKAVNVGSGDFIDCRRFMVTANFNNAQVGDTVLTHVNLPVGDTLSGTVPISIPCNFYEENTIKVTVTPYNDKDATNNNLSSTILLSNPDFLAFDIEAPAQLNSGETFAVTYKVTNNGSAKYYGEIDLGLYLGLSPELNFITAERLKLETFPFDLDINDTIQITQYATLPVDAEGLYYIYVNVNDGETICEGDNVNTDYIVSDMLTVTLSPYPDLYFLDASTSSEAVAGGTIHVSYEMGNQGIRDVLASESWTDAVYISNNPQFNTETSTLLGSITKNGPLAIGGSYSVTQTFTLPANLPADNYYIYIIADATDAIFEYVGEYNNTYQSASVPLTAYSLDLAVTDINGNDEVEWNERVNVSYTVSNLGTRSTISHWTDKIFLSTDASWDVDDIMLGEIIQNDVLPGNGSYTENVQVVIPYGKLGAYYILAVTDVNSANPDENSENNVGALQVNISSIPVPNLEVSDVTVLTEFPACGQPILVSYRVTNIGDGPTCGTWNDQVRFSKNTFNNGTVASNVTRSDTLSPGDYYIDTASFVVPVPQSGNYAVYIYANQSKAMFEMDYENNLTMIPVVLTLNPPVDLVVESIEHPTTIMSGDDITITWTVKNNGPNTATGVGCSDVVYLSTDTQFDVNDKLLGSVSYDMNLPIVTSETHSLTANIAGLHEGNYYIIVITDARNTFYEADEDNNIGCSSSPFKVELPVLYFDHPETFELKKLEYKDFKLEVLGAISETARVYIVTPDSLMGAVNNIYVLHNDIGDNLNYDFSTDGQMSGNSELFIPRTEAGYYGVSFYGFSPVNETQEVTVEAQILPFEIRSISPNKGGNTGNVTVKIIGSKFRHDMPVRLFKSNGTDTISIYADTLRYVNFNQVFATFNLKGAELGVYSLEAYNYCAGYTYLNDCFTVVEGEPELLATNLIIPEGLRANRYCCLTLEYGNLGTNDIVAPKIQLRSLGESWIGLRRGELNIHRTVLEIPTDQFEDEPDGILRPGVRHTITIYCFTNAEMLFCIDVNDEIEAYKFLKNVLQF